MKSKETEIMEYKTSTSELKEGIISIVAILNKHREGELYFGIKRDGEVVGQMVSEKTLRDVSMAISNHIEPKIFPKIEEIIIEEKTCIKVEFKGNNVPYYAYGRSYVRTADEDRPMSPQELEKFILDKNKDKLAWDKEICEEAKISDINSKRLIWFLKKAGKKYTSIENALDKLGLLKSGKLLNAAIILFGKTPERFFSNAELRCAVFGETTATTIDMTDFKGNLFTLIENAEKYILENIHKGMRLEGLFRVDVPEIDKDAFREAIINAFCHRDYYEPAEVQVAIFENRLEIRSPGGLYGGLTIEQIRSEQVSKRRNELIASLFREIHFVEKWGRGIGLILSKEPDTEFEVIADIFITRFRRKTMEEKASEALGEKLGEKLGENMVKILRSIDHDNYITNKELADKLEISTTAIENNISKLKKKGLLKRVGAAKGGHWEVTEK